MLKDLLKTLHQLRDPRLTRVLVLSLILAVVLYVGLVAAAGWALTTFSLFDLAWLDSIVRFLGGLAVGLIALLLFPSFAMAIQGLLLEDVTQAVESRHYPDLPEPRPQSWGELAMSTGRIVLVAVAVNAVMLPLYLALTFVPPLNFALFYLVNGWLLGREYFESVALRRMPPPAARAFRLANRGHVWLAGALIAFLFSIPVLNLAAPVIGTGFMLHRFEALRARDRAATAKGSGRTLRNSTMAAMLLVTLIAAALFASRGPFASGPFDLRAEAARLSERDGPPDPKELMGLVGAEVQRRLGPPELLRREGAARVWQYTSATCVLDLYLYPEQSDFRVVFLRTRSRRSDREPGRWCYAGIMATERSATAASPVSAQR